jgi:hypothetical protein
MVALQRIQRLSPVGGLGTAHLHAGKIGRVDGRYVHWVRGYDRITRGQGADHGQAAGGTSDSGGDGKAAAGKQATKEGTRYSVIYYINRGQHATDRAFAVDEKWKPAGRAASDYAAGGGGGGGGGGGMDTGKGRGTFAVVCSVVVACVILMAAARRLR